MKRETILLLFISHTAAKIHSLIAHCEILNDTRAHTGQIFFYFFYIDNATIETPAFIENLL